MKARIGLVAAMGAWLGCSLGGYGQTGQAPAPVKPAFMTSGSVAPGYQPPTLAQTIARTLQESGQLSQYRVNVNAQNGEVDLTGEVADESQRDIVARLVKGTPGVVVVRDWLKVRSGSKVMTAQGVDVPPGEKAKDRIDGPLPEPLPIFHAPVGPSAMTQPPPLPPYAWPTFAPYNNYSRVAYPLAYSYEQWPNIGPQYPFPRVPLGWRSVSLTWEDGHWWFHRNPTGHDWWRLRYW